MSKSSRKKNENVDDGFDVPLLKRAPTAPGVFIKRLLVQFDMTQEELADKLLVTRVAVNQLIKGRRALSADVALRLSKLTGTTPQFWLNMQQDVDLWNARRLVEEDPRIRSKHQRIRKLLHPSGEFRLT